ncbi:30S ribosomal protein S6 [Candidatus Peregrinibacteria bacterium CG1_02_54_53]|nr:MAG: 30S ribosomal protein S6 [Candidatus Peregrinibacteria bacterium CG1_02_54_53]
MPTLTPTPEDTVIYEFCVLYPSNLSQKEEQTLLKGIEEIFAEAEAKELLRDAWGRRGLAYPIKKQTEGNFVVLYIEMDPTKVREIDRQLRILPHMLRHLIVRPPKDYEVTKFSQRFEQWLKDRETAVETERKEEEKRLQRKVVEKAKREVKRTEAKKKAPTSTLEEADLSKKLDELISDDSLGL